MRDIGAKNMVFQFDVNTLSGNPAVYRVETCKLTLCTDIKIELFKLWKKGDWQESVIVCPRSISVERAAIGSPHHTEFVIEPIFCINTVE